MAYLYRHVRIDKNEPFYIGIGSDDKYRRAEAKKGRNKFWKSIVSKTDYTIEIILDDISFEQAKEKEKEFIALYGRRDLGTGSLVNLTDGGDGTVGVIRTEEWKRKQSLKLKGRKCKPKSLEQKKKMSEAHKIRYYEKCLDMDFYRAQLMNF